MKIAISIPKEDYHKIEKIRKKLGFPRSQERQQLIKRYKDGYKNKPEDARKIKAMEDVCADALKKEGLRFALAL